MFERVLIANRGEIAVRIARTLREMGIRCVVVASIPDRRSFATRVADETVLLEGYSAAETYLDIDAIIAAAEATGCKAIHPGYGFLSERADFAERCGAEGITFIGPPPAVLRSLGDKSSARLLAVEAGVPVVPGWDGDDDPATLTREAVPIGFPVMVKARGGGGGRGMRVVTSPDDLPAAIESSRREALAAFGDGGLLLEKLITKAHHVEVQVFGDTQGNLVHLGERDCSVQRRRQKLIEESPSPVVDDELRARLTDAALRIARAVDYVNAGTVEFLVTAPNPDGRRDFYFLEVNPRLQVEHPVTEMVTGLDLVEWQLRVAAGEPLPLTRDVIRFEGHAIEFRINAEDPFNDFRPSSGRLTWVSDDERWDAGYEPGDEVPGQYDSLIGKRVFHESTREAAIDCAVAVADADDFAGITTNAGLVRAIARSAEFRAGNATVDWLEEEMEILLDASRTTPEEWVAAALGHEALHGGSWMAPGARSLWFNDGQETVELALEQIGPGRYRASALGSAFECRSELRDPQWGLVVEIQVGGEPRSVIPGHAADIGGPDLYVSRGFWIVPPPPLPRRAHAAAEGTQTLLAPLSGTIAAVAATEGADVSEGDLLVVLEAMKMEHRLLAPSPGKVTSVSVRPGDVVREGDLLIELS